MRNFDYSRWVIPMEKEVAGVENITNSTAIDGKEQTVSLYY